MSQNSEDQRPRVLHLLKWLPRGGIETWLTHVFAASKNGPFRHEVLLMQDEIGPYEGKVRAAGVKIHTLAMRARAQWFVHLHRFLKREGPFAIFHAHVDSIVSGPALAVAASAGIPVRIIHNHAARSTGADYQKLRYRLREGFGNAIAMRASTTAIGISELAMRHLAGSAWKDREDCTILLYGFDYSAFADAGTRTDNIRGNFAIASDATIVGHVGRFDPVKNHEFLLQIFASFSGADRNAILVLIGKGPLQGEYERQAKQLGIVDRVRFVGGTDDIAAFMRLFDIFVLTSFSEGLGIVLLEAQAAGTPVLMPNNMPQEVVVLQENVVQLPLGAGVERWGRAIEEITQRARPDPSQSLARVEASAFGMERCVAELEAIYCREIARAG